jgi:transcriptional regulator of arginine metabolism
VTKTYRQAQILKLIRAHPIRTQEELSATLGKSGIEVAQVTLSRDIRQLGLVKGPNGYQEPPQAAFNAEEAAVALRRAVAEYIREVKVAENLIVIKTFRGTAAPMADALDQEAWPEIAGTIAGEDTIFVAAYDARRAQKVKDRILALLR